MKFLITRTTNCNNNKPPVEGAIKYKAIYSDYRTSKTLEIARKKCNQHWYDMWYKNGLNHREENGMIVCEQKKKHTVWYIEMDNVLDFCEEYGQIILYKQNNYKEFEYSIEIYDGWRE